MSINWAKPLAYRLASNECQQSPKPLTRQRFERPSWIASKNGQKFRDFSRRAAEAGAAGYFAFLRGQRVTYFGRQGDQHVEWFPGAKQTDA